MKRNRLLSVLLTVALLISTATISVSAATFSDISSHWAKSYIETVSTLGLVNGYDDGTFGPDNETTYCEALLFCSRVIELDSDTESDIIEKWYDDVYDCLPSSITWAASELSICVEYGIISLDELATICADGSITSTITREQLTCHLTRAIQLDELAENLSSTSMSFYDYSSIGSDYLPYVFLLNYYEIIQGDENGYFNPQDSVTRAAMCTVLSRVIDLIDEEGILFETADFNDYDSWYGGVITSASTSTSTGITTLKLESDAWGSKTVYVPAAAEIYRFNLPTTYADFSEGDYVRVNYNSSGTITTVLISGSTSTDDGTIVSISQDSVSIWGNDGYAVYALDAFTAVSIANQKGDTSIIDLTEEYTSAQCTINQMGQVTDLVLQGGTSIIEGIFYKYSSSTLQYTGLDGVLYSYPVSDSVSFSVDGSSASTLSSSLSGDYIVFYLDNDSGTVTAASIDTTVTMLQGSIKTYSTSADPRTLTIKDLDSGYSTKYYVDDDAVIYQEGEEISMSDLEKSYFVTALFDGDTDDYIINIWATLDTYYVSGTLLSIDYDTITALELLLEDGTYATYYIDISDMPDIERNDEDSTISKLRAGDYLELEIEYNIISEIEATSVTTDDADLIGTIIGISKTSAGTYIEVELEDGDTETYLLSSSVSVVQDGEDLSTSDLDIDMEVSLLLSDDLIYYIEIDGTSSTLVILTVKIISIDSDDKIFDTTLDGNSSILISVDVSGASYREWDGTSYSFSSFEPGDYIQVYGNYSGSTFLATMAVYLY